MLAMRSASERARSTLEITRFSFLPPHSGQTGSVTRLIERKKTSTRFLQLEQSYW